MRKTRSAKPENEIREFVDAIAILYKDYSHRAWLIRAGEEFIYTGKVTTNDDRTD